MSFQLVSYERSAVGGQWALGTREPRLAVRGGNAHQPRMLGWGREDVLGEL